MIFLILLLAVCNAVHMNSNYFQSESVMPSNCTIQPTQHECIEYAQLTMTPDFGYVKVSSGSSQTEYTYKEVTSGSPSSDITASECLAYAINNGLTHDTSYSWTSEPSGCWRRIIASGQGASHNKVYFNTANTNVQCGITADGTTFSCVQRDTINAAYVTEEECQAYGTARGDWHSTNTWNTYITGCFYRPGTQQTYFNRNQNPNGITNECQAAQNCIQKHSYYNFGHVEVTAGTPALESDIRYVGEKECEAYAGDIGLIFDTQDTTSRPPGCWQSVSTPNQILYNFGSYIGVWQNCHSSNPCIQRDVITHHAAAEGCLSDGKVRWNIPFLEVSSGSPATLAAEVTEGKNVNSVSETECSHYTSSDLYGGNFDSAAHPGGCYRAGATSGTVWYNTNAGIDCNPTQPCIQKSPTAAAYVSEEECSLYANSEFYYPSNYGATSPEGCFLHSNGKVQFHTGDGADQCNSAGHKCIQKPTTELPCAPHQCICKRGNVVGTTYQAGSLSDHFWEYREVTSGYNDASISREECKLFGEQHSKTISNGLNGDPWNSGFYPSNCYYDGNWIYFNDNQNAQQCSSTKICIQKGTKTHKFFEVTTGVPATFAVEVSSGSPAQEGSPEWMSESDCQAYAEANSLTWSGIQSESAREGIPNGCVVQRETINHVKFNPLTTSVRNCGDYWEGGSSGYPWLCIQKIPFNTYVSQSECEQYASSNWDVDSFTHAERPSGCFLHTNGKYYYNSQSTTVECSSTRPCIQKAPFHAQSVQSIVKQAIDAVLHAEMHYAESVNVFIEDFDHPKTTASDTLYTKQASYEVTDFNFLYSTITANEEWRPALQFNTLEEAKVSCSADSSNCLGVTHRHLGGVDIYLRHNGNSHSQLASHEQEHDERLYFQLLDRPFFIRFPIKASTVVNSDLKALCDSYPSCFARGNYVNTHDAEWDSSNYPGHTSGNYIAVFYKQFQLQQATKVNAVYTSPTYAQVSSGKADGSMTYDECVEYAEANGKPWSGSHTWNGYPIGCFLNANNVYYNLASTTTECSASNICIQKPKYVLVDSGAPDGSSLSEAECEAYSVAVGDASRYNVIALQYYTLNPHGCFVTINGVYWNAGSSSVYCSSNKQCVTRSYVSVDTLYEAFQGCNASTSCEGITGYQEVTVGAAATQTVLLDQDLLINDGDDFQLLVYDFQTGDCAGSGGAYTVTTYNDKGNFHVLEACHYSSNIVINPASFFGKRVLKKTAVSTQTCSEDCTSLGYTVSQMTDSGIRFITVHSGAQATNVDESECEAYAVSVNKPYSNAISSQASNQWSNYIPGCQADSVNVYWNPSTSSTKVCGHGGNACIQKVHDANCLCTQKVGTSGHNIKTDCFTGFEFKEEVVQVGSGSPAAIGDSNYVSQAECQVFAQSIGETFVGTQNNENDLPGCYNPSNANVMYNSNFDNNNNYDCSLKPCIQKRKACQPCPAGTTIAIFSLVTSGAPDMSVSLTECEQYAATNWGGSGNFGTTVVSGCFLQGQIMFNTATSVTECSNSRKCIQKATSGCDLCPAGSDSVPYSSECFTCPDGESSVPGGRCTNCNAGQFQAGGSGCTNCNAGLYQNENGAAVCKSCPIGSSSNAGSDALTDCNLCTAAYYLVGNTCTICPGGKYSGALASSCTNCGIGTYGQSGVCSVCQAGKFQNEQGKSSCKLCPQGSYRTATGGSSSSSCTSCTAGKYNGNQGSTSNVCTNCPAGTISAARAPGCSSCPAGQFQASASSCGSCPAGQYQNLNRQTSCKLCGAGKYHNNNGQTAESACTNCAAGTHSSADAASCTTCAAGTYSSAGAGTCSDCNAAKYSTATGATSATTCQNCAAGRYSSAGAAECIDCPKGKFSPLWTEGSASCQGCDSGKYSDETGRAYVGYGYTSYSGNVGSTEWTTDPPANLWTGANTRTLHECFLLCRQARDAPKDCRYFAAVTLNNVDYACWMYGPGTNNNAYPTPKYKMTSTDPNFRDSCKNCPSGKTSPFGSDALADCVSNVRL